jgi:hypothetical protein
LRFGTKTETSTASKQIKTGESRKGKSDTGGREEEGKIEMGYARDCGSKE